MARKGWGVLLLGMGVLLGGAYHTTLNPANLSRNPAEPVHLVESIETRPIQSAWWCTAFSMVCREATAENPAADTQEGTTGKPGTTGQTGQAGDSTEETPVVFKWKLGEWWQSHFSS